VDIYIDDFIGLAQQPTAQRTLRVLLHSIDAIFRAHPHPDDKPGRKQIISSSKLEAGDGAWSTKKIILGWLIDTAAGTIQLPDHKVERLEALLQHFLHVSRTSRKKWYSLLGELRHMSVAIKGAAYLFSILQSILVDQPTAKRVHLGPLIHASLADWQHLAHTLHTHPVPISSLVPRAPTFLGAVDASGAGIGGFWVPSAAGPQSSPIVFRVPFPAAVQARLISTANPSGGLTNSDFELAALVVGVAIGGASNTYPNATFWCGSDNVAAVSWCTKGSTSSIGPQAHLLRWLAQLTRQYTCSIHCLHIPGVTNTLADFCSRSFHLSDQAFLDHLNLHYPISPSWTLAPVTSDLTSKLNWTLSSQMFPWESHPNEPLPPTPPGSSGKDFALTLTSIQPWKTRQTKFSPSNSSPIVIVGDKYLPAKLKCAAERWATPFVPLARRWPTWDTPTPEYYPPANSIFA
jgi:hypothetical protein